MFRAKSERIVMELVLNAAMYESAMAKKRKDRRAVERHGKGKEVTKRKRNEELIFVWEGLKKKLRGRLQRLF